MTLQDVTPKTPRKLKTPKTLNSHPGFAGIDNELYFSDRTWMLFGDAKNVIGELVKQFAGESGMHRRCSLLGRSATEGRSQRSPRRQPGLQREATFSILSRMTRWLGIILSFSLVFPAAACGGSESRTQAENRETSAPPSSSVPATRAAPNPSGQPFAFTAADLEAYERGLAKEIELVKAARQRGMEAKTAQERGAAEQATWEDSTIPGGAAAAGLSEDRYRQVRKTVNKVLRTLDFQGKIDGPLSIDLERASPEMREEVAKDPFAALASASAAALRSRMDRLVPLWAEYMTLTAVAG